MNPSRPHLKDVARRAGVSLGTASHALRGDGEVAPATRQKVREVAQAMGYRANLAASLLGSRRPSAAPVAGIPLAVLVTSRLYPHGELRLALHAAGARLGYTVFEEAEAGTPLSRERQVRRLWNRGVQGLFLSHESEHALTAAPGGKALSAVVLGVHPSMPHDGYTSDAFRTLDRLLHLTRSRGYQRIGVALCRHRREFDDDRRRQAAYVYARATTGEHGWVAPYHGEHEDLDAPVLVPAHDGRGGLVAAGFQSEDGEAHFP